MRIATSTLLAPLFLCLTLADTTQATSSNDLTVEVGHHVIFSYPGLEPPTHLFDLIKQGKVGGIILFGENVDSNLSNVIENFQNAYQQSPTYAGFPLLITTDQEGGQIRRLPGGPEQSAKQVGQSTDPKGAATKAGQDAAVTLKEYKMNANLAPVLDVYREADDFTDQYGRSFSNSSAVVSECGLAFITAQQKAGVLATAKHFPGLGAALKDSNTDEEPVTIDLTLRQLHTVDLVPYKDAIAAGLDMVMTSWAIYPALDDKYPSGLSKKWVQGELRGRLGFEGVTITDAIEAGALKSFGDDATRGLLAAQAGMDILLASGRNVSQGEAIVNGLVAALQNGNLSKDLFSEATDRILGMRKRIQG
ncbi:Glycoside hydrolase superfamily [Penicillium cosmopolitanum]|uniref:Glycoside hydrolase superfamily n=1 Tax=Penicillium cosmopolitanum TaxID=1131564 RepID=A0A9W9W6H5_9EURO|nr:Glycoside hydrolase superfamily [Penicillium cosmopolitanum]KAJ5404379.1 Glycoside hydrolase superfamily [Penicillium cosmopolitanum]